jgi:putative zinc finger/helix-turn-helix YgiT family protein
MKTLNCPKGHGPMGLKTLIKNITFKGVDLTFETEAHVCPVCGLEAGTVATAGATQQRIADAYRAKQNLLTGEEIRGLRKARHLTQQQLAELMSVGIASIKRWETGTVQSASMDHALRVQLQCRIPSNAISGNREFSLNRIKLVAGHFEILLKEKLLKKGDKFLFLAKYLWYADMLAFRGLGRSMTGATYAALPYGPQLNNYRDLVDAIRDSDKAEAEPLSEEELRIIRNVSDHFPQKQMVYDAAHRERVWAETPTGALISYSCASDLTEI